MSQCWIEDAEGPCSCDNCDWEGDASELEMISDIEQRLSAGGVVPAGQCPDCGALAYLTNPPEWTRDPVKEAAPDMLAALSSFVGLVEMTGPRNLDQYKAVIADAKAAIAKAQGKPEEPKPDLYETAARAAGWTHGGDAGGFWFHVETWGSWKAAASWHGTDQEPEDGHSTIYDSAREVCEREGIEVTA